MGVTSTQNPLMLLFWGETGYGNAQYMEATWSAGDSGLGAGKLSFNHMVGVEAFSDKTLACLEKSPEFSVERWNVDSVVPSYTGKSIRGQGDADNLFNNPQDVTVDLDDWVYVLDILSTGQPRIKIFDENLIPVAGMGDSTSITGTPLRIDWDDYNDALHVLTSTGVAVFPK